MHEHVSGVARQATYSAVSGLHDAVWDISGGWSDIVPHANWRGRFDAGTCPAGVAPGVYIIWPGDEDRVFHSTPSPSGGRGDWMGGLLNEQKDASGLMYRRNRYYDPQTGRFTQEDPIGIAGGLNVYGYAAGDPVSYSDPYGLCAAHQVQDPPSEKAEDREKVCPGGLTHGEYYQREDRFAGSSLHRQAPQSATVLAGHFQSPQLIVECAPPRIRLTTEANISVQTSFGPRTIGRVQWTMFLPSRTRRYLFGTVGPTIRVDYLGTMKILTGTLRKSFPATGWVRCQTGDLYLESVLPY